MNEEKITFFDIIQTIFFGIVFLIVAFLPIVVIGFMLISPFLEISEKKYIYTDLDGNIGQARWCEELYCKTENKIIAVKEWHIEYE